MVSFTHASFRYKVIDTAFPVLITGIPVLDGRVFYFCTVVGDYLYYCRMQLVFVTHRSGTPFEIAYITVVIGYD